MARLEAAGSAALSVGVAIAPCDTTGVIATGGFELRGTDDDETRILVHTQLGYSIAIPGHPRLLRAAGDGPSRDVVVKMVDAPIELGLRMDEVPTKITPDHLATALLTSYAQMRARDPAAVASQVLSGKMLPLGAATGTCASYKVVGNIDDAMEFIAITLKPARNEIVHAVHMTVRYRISETTPFAWSNLRSLLLRHQSWEPGRPARASVWPATSAFLKLSPLFELTDEAKVEAKAKADDVGEIDRATVNQLADLLLDSTNENWPPIDPWSDELTHDIAIKIAMCVGTRVAEVLLRDTPQINSVHDFRGWLWECYWGVGNRAQLRKRN